MVSICATCYNHERYVPEFVKSVQAQLCGDWELCVVDDCSTDGSFALLQECAARDPRIRVFRNDRNRHVCYSGNRAVAESRGDIVVLISCDDLVLPNLTGYYERYFREHPATSVLYPLFDVLKDGVLLEDEWPIEKDFSRTHLLRRELFVHNSMNVVGLAFRRGTWESLGGYDPLLRMTQDYELHIRVLEQATYARANEKTIVYRLHGDNLSARSDAFENAVANESVYFLTRHYLSGITSVADLLAVCPECRKYGEPVVDAIPYFVSRFAIEFGEEPAVRFAGLLALQEFLRSEKVRRMLEERYSFLEKDFMQLSELPALNVASRLMRAESALVSMESSVSYRLGLALTWPLRKAYRGIVGK